MILKELDINLIDPPGYAVRSVIDDGELMELAEDINRNGLIHPIVVLPTGDRYEVIAGHRRFLAHRLLGRSTISAQLLMGDEHNADAIRLAENYNRAEVSPLDEAMYFNQLVVKGNITNAQLALKIGRSAPYVGQRLALLKLPESIAESLSAGRISASAALTLSKCPNPTYLAYYLNQAEEQGANTRTIQAWLSSCPLPAEGIGTSDATLPSVLPMPTAPTTPSWVCGICGERKPASECLMVPICLSCNSQIK